VVVSQGQIGQDIVLIAISSVVRGALAPTDYTVESTHPEFALTGLRVTSVLRMHKLAAVERSVIVRRLGRLGPQLQTEVDRVLRVVLGL
jgi:mRNA interferase MazF